MKIAQVRELDITNGEGLGISIFTQGCPFHCKNCFNPETWDFNGGVPFTAYFNQIMNLMKKDYITRLSILGGEPMIDQNVEELSLLIKSVKKEFPKKKIWLYTGNTFEELWEKENNYSIFYREILLNIDFLIDGRYIDSLKDSKLKFRGSSNQRIIDMQKTLEQKTIILKDL